MFKGNGKDTYDRCVKQAWKIEMTSIITSTHERRFHQAVQSINDVDWSQRFIYEGLFFISSSWPFKFVLVGQNFFQRSGTWAQVMWHLPISLASFQGIQLGCETSNLKRQQYQGTIVCLLSFLKVREKERDKSLWAPEHPQSEREYLHRHTHPPHKTTHTHVCVYNVFRYVKMYTWWRDVSDISQTGSCAETMVALLLLKSSWIPGTNLYVCSSE